MCTDPDLVADARTAAVEALRWAAGAAAETDGGASWPETRADGAQLADDLYDGTAGVLMAFAEAELYGQAPAVRPADGRPQAALGGITGFREPAAAAAGRLRWIVEAGPAGQLRSISRSPMSLIRR